MQPARGESATCLVIPVLPPLVHQWFPACTSTDILLYSSNLIFSFPGEVLRKLFSPVNLLWCWSLVETRHPLLAHLHHDVVLAGDAEGGGLLLLHQLVQALPALPPRTLH